MQVASRRQILRLPFASWTGLASLQEGDRSFAAPLSNHPQLDPGLFDFVNDGMGQVVIKIRRGSVRPEDFLHAGRHAKLLGHHLKQTGFDDFFRSAAGQIDPASVDFTVTHPALQQMVQLLQKYDPSLRVTDIVPRVAPTLAEATELRDNFVSNGVSPFFLDAAETLKKAFLLQTANELRSKKAHAHNIASHYEMVAFLSTAKIPDSICKLLPSDFCQDPDKYKNAAVFIAEVLVKLCANIPTGVPAELQAACALLASDPGNWLIKWAASHLVSYLVGHCCGMPV